MGGFIRKIFRPEMPVFEKPEIDDVPFAEDQEREEAAKEELTQEQIRRKGRRSTILTGSQGLNEIDEDNLKTKTLLGG